MNEPVREREDEGAPERVCATCGHGESEHVEQEAEVAGNTLRRTACESCGEWHEFTTAPPVP